MEEENIDIDYNYDEYYDYQYESGINDYHNNLQRENSYMILKSSDIEKLKSRIIEEAREFTSLSKEEATVVLIQYQWNIEKFRHLWYENVDENKKRCGIELTNQAKLELESYNKKRSDTDVNKCRICEISEIDSTAYSLKCGHKFCSDCWKEYVYYKMEDTFTCILATCPQMGCNIIVPESVFLKFLNNDKKLKEEYQKALLKNFTDLNSDIKWCPTPDCGICVRVLGHSMKEIECECRQVFCFSCGNEGHRPCDCQMVQKWNKKNQSESENVKWLVANTKQCPSCRKYIEKNQGCNHMTCRKEAGGCSYEFCWVCLGDWKSHGNNYYQCTKYDKNKEISKEEAIKNAKLELEKYVFYFDRYMNHQKSQQLGVKLKSKIKELSELLRSIHNIPYEELYFLEDAVDTIIHARRTLKNTYIFRYYMIDCKEKTLFEHNQFLLDRDTDKLHGVMEGETISNIIEAAGYEEFTKMFNEFKNNVINSLSAINKYRENLLSEIENNMLHLVNYKNIN